MKTKDYASAKKTLQVLNDLIRINIDRIAGFERSAHEDLTPAPDLRDAYYRMAVEGRANVNALHAEVIRLGGPPVTQATISGKIYLHWLDSGLPAGEATETAYHQALAETIPEKLHLLIETQLWSLERANQRLHDLETANHA